MGARRADRYPGQEAWLDRHCQLADRPVRGADQPHAPGRRNRHADGRGGGPPAWKSSREGECMMDLQFNKVRLVAALGAAGLAAMASPCSAIAQESVVVAQSFD